MTAPVAASAEIIAHHVREHGKRCAMAAVFVAPACSHGAVVYVCASCRTVVFLGLPEPAEWCPHAETILHGRWPE